MYRSLNNSRAKIRTGSNNTSIGGDDIDVEVIEPPTLKKQRNRNEQHMMSQPPIQ